MWKVKILSRFCQDFVPITCHENIMQVSIMLHITFSYRFNTFNYKLWDIFAYNIARFITLAICSKYAWILGFQTFTIFFVEIFLTTHIEEKIELKKSTGLVTHGQPLGFFKIA
jgi:hypothetical protein